ncbi:MAG: AEC family transporter [Alphaproteobacteria bacterium]
MLPIVLAIAPVFLLILLGYGIRARRLLADEFWEPAERLIYFILFPALLISTLASAKLGDLDIGPMAAALVAAIVVLTTILLLLRPLLGWPGPAFTSVFQGIVRQNTYIGLAVAMAVFGEEGLAAAAVAVAVIVPLVNLMSVTVLERYGAGGRSSWLGAVRQVARNPLIIACAIGIALNVSGIGLPPVIGPFLDIVGRAALPLGLIAVGAGLDLAAARIAGPPVALAVGLRLIGLPALTVLACQVLDVGPVAAFVAVLFNSTPASPSSYVLARLLGGDARLMAGIITVQTAISMITLPLVLTFGVLP